MIKSPTGLRPIFTKDETWFGWLNSTIDIKEAMLWIGIFLFALFVISWIWNLRRLNERNNSNKIS